MSFVTFFSVFSAVSGKHLKANPSLLVSYVYFEAASLSLSQFCKISGIHSMPLTILLKSRTPTDTESSTVSVLHVTDTRDIGKARINCFAWCGLNAVKDPINIYR